MTALQTLVNIIVSLDFGAAVLLFFIYWSYIIETLRRPYFLLLAESMSFSVKLHRAQAKLNDYIWGNSSFWMRTSDLKAAIIALGCVFFFTPPPSRRNWSFVSLVAKWNMFLSSGGTLFSLFTLLARCQFLHRLQLSKKKRKKQSWDKLTDILVSVIHCLSHDWTNGCHIFLGTRSVYHLWFRMESQVEWVLLLSLKRLLAVLWHMDNPTRNQSLHSYRGNRWANMFPGGCPYYSGATGPPGDSGARWNWGVVTTEWTGNELLQDKWAATWEMRNLPTNSRGSGWMAASTLLPQLHSSYIYMPFSFLNWAGISECRRCWMAGRMNE